MRRIMTRIASLLLGLFMVLPTAGYSDLNLAQRPLFVGASVKPNLLFLLDDSGSMRWGYMPDNLNDADATLICFDVVNYAGNSDVCALKTDSRRYLASSHLNTVYFDPTITYRPPVSADGTRYPDASFTNAYVNGYAQSGTTVNLSSGYRALMDDYYQWGYKTWKECTFAIFGVCVFEETRYAYGSGFAISPTGNAGQAFYYSFRPGCGDAYSDSCYDLVQPIPDNQKQNFANWFSYYRTRLMASKAGIGDAFNALPDSFRLGWGAINYNDGSESTVDGASVRALIQGVRDYDSAHRSSFYTWLYGKGATGGTPLRKALEGAGKYYENSQKAWADDPDQNISDSNPVRECRQAFTILTTDGYYDNDESVSANLYQADDVDGATITNPAGRSYQYRAGPPFSDSRNATTLADIAMYYWKRDLRDDIDNFVPSNNSRNPAFWQHMVTYGVSLGVSGSVTDVDAAFNAISTGTAVDWWGGNAQQNKINDLLHAAVNSRGGFYSATNPSEFAENLSKALEDMAMVAGSATSVEFEVSNLQEGSQIFAAQFDPNGWSGDVKAATLGVEDGEVVIPNLSEAIEAGTGWSAKAKLDARNLADNDRTILSYGGGKGVAFRWNNLSDALKLDLRHGGASEEVGRQRLDYLRGDRSREGTAGFRLRGSRLGDIVNSSPEYVGRPRGRWPDSALFGADGARYSSFVSSKANRTPVVYAGANDGMLHGFKATADGGQELLAYVPSFLASTEASKGLHYLVNPGYQHRYYVDLPSTQWDVYTKGRDDNGNLDNNRAWRTVLVGGGGLGAPGIFLLDVTNPDNFAENKAGRLVLWEFSAANDNRLGYITRPPTIALASWGRSENEDGSVTHDLRWTVFLPNGYNSATKTTGFFMLDVEGGLDGTWTENTDYRFIEFESGGPGLSPMMVLDTTGSFLADRIYAGDLDGNLWVATEGATGWSSAYETAGGDPEPLFKAGLPITSAPVVAANTHAPKGGNLPNLMVYFGSGQYLEADDVFDDTTQYIYGVWDRGQPGLTKDNLAQRTFDVGSMTYEGKTYPTRVSEGDELDFNSDRGWYLELEDSGERVIHSPQLRNELVFVNSIIPDVDPCKPGGRSWLMVLGTDGRTPVKKGFLNLPENVAGYQIDGLANQSTMTERYRVTPTTAYPGGQGEDGDGPRLDEIEPETGAVNVERRRGWQEVIP